ncbi:MAG: hypothetical protein ACOY0T_35645 [Myxococcota bacterium]
MSPLTRRDGATAFPDALQSGAIQRGAETFGISETLIALDEFTANECCATLDTFTTDTFITWVVVVTTLISAVEPKTRLQAHVKLPSLLPLPQRHPDRRLGCRAPRDACTSAKRPIIHPGKSMIESAILTSSAWRILGSERSMSSSFSATASRYKAHLKGGP